MSLVVLSLNNNAQESNYIKTNATIYSIYFLIFIIISKLMPCASIAVYTICVSIMSLSAQSSHSALKT